MTQEELLETGKPFTDYSPFAGVKEYFDDQKQWWRAMYNGGEYFMYKLINGNYIMESTVSGYPQNRCSTLHRRNEQAY